MSQKLIARLFLATCFLSIVFSPSGKSQRPQQHTSLWSREQIEAYLQFPSKPVHAAGLTTLLPTPTPKTTPKIEPTKTPEPPQAVPVAPPTLVVASVQVEVVAPIYRPIVHESNVGNWDALLQQYFGASWQAAKAIMICESGGNSNAVGDRSTAYPSYGLMQIRALPGRPSPAQLLDPEFNISYAAGLWRSQGFAPWSCRRVLR